MADNKTYNQQRYDQIMEAFRSFPNILPRIIKNSTGDAYKLKKDIHIVYGVHLPVRILKDTMQSTTDLKTLIADAYAKKSNYTSTLNMKSI